MTSACAVRRGKLSNQALQTDLVLADARNQAAERQNVSQTRPR